MSTNKYVTKYIQNHPEEWKKYCRDKMREYRKNHPRLWY